MTTATLLLRHVHPRFIQQGRPSSQAFRPTPKDENKLSAYDGDQITAEASWMHYTGVLQYTSAGVLAVTVAECGGLDLPAAPDPKPFKEHCTIDFSAHSSSAAGRTGKALLRLALNRGWQFQPIAGQANVNVIAEAYIPPSDAPPAVAP
jgi:hypothetical protein